MTNEKKLSAYGLTSKYNQNGDRFYIMSGNEIFRQLYKTSAGKWVPARWNDYNNQYVGEIYLFSDTGTPHGESIDSLASVSKTYKSPSAYIDYITRVTDDYNLSDEL